MSPPLFHYITTFTGSTKIKRSIGASTTRSYLPNSRLFSSSSFSMPTWAARHRARSGHICKIRSLEIVKVKRYAKCMARCPAVQQMIGLLNATAKTSAILYPSRRHLIMPNVGRLSWRPQRGGSGDHYGSIPNFRSRAILGRSITPDNTYRMFDPVPAAWLYFGTQQSQPLQHPRLIYRRFSDRKKKCCRNLGKTLAAESLLGHHPAGHSSCHRARPLSCTTYHG
jgi:hypothetical protein